MQKDPVVIVSCARTPMGAFQGELKDFSAAQLGAAAIRAAVERAKLKPEQVQEVIMGCVLPAGQGQAPARQAVLAALHELDAVPPEERRRQRRERFRRMGVWREDPLAYTIPVPTEIAAVKSSTRQSIPTSVPS